MADLKPRLSPKTQLAGQLLTRLRFSAILELSEGEFSRLVQEIESDPLFEKLLNPKSSGQSVVSWQKYPNSRWNQSFLEYREELKSEAAGQNLEIESVLEKHSGLLDLIRKIGQSNFERYFLYMIEPKPPQQIAEACGIGEPEVRKIQELLLEVAVKSEFILPSRLPQEGDERSVCIASLMWNEKNEIEFNFTSPFLARGRYRLLHHRMKEFRQGLDSIERRKLSQLLTKMEWANLRQDSLYRLLFQWSKSQHDFLKTDGSHPEKMRPLSQRGMARVMKVAASTICRLVGGKSIVLPWGEEIKLKRLFPNRKQVVLNAFEEMELDASHPQWNDTEIQKQLKENYGVVISRRAVNLYRNERKKSL